MHSVGLMTSDSREPTAASSFPRGGDFWSASRRKGIGIRNASPVLNESVGRHCPATGESKRKGTSTLKSLYHDPMRQLADRAMSKLSRLLVHVFFRSVELQCEENLPKTGPVVLVANHVNGLVDGLLLMATLDRYPRFLGKSTLFKIVPLWPFLKFAGVIPVYRASDGVPGDQNVSAFATCHDILAHNGVVALFPEGISHDESSLQPLKTGAARIALGAGFDRGVNSVVTVAVGLTYETKSRFRSRALVRIAEPVSISPWSEEYQLDSQKTVRVVTDDVARQLAGVSPTYISWDQAEKVNRIAEVVVRSPKNRLPSDVSMADQVEAGERLAKIERQDPGDARLQSLLAAFAVYERDLEFLGLSDSQIAAEYPRGRFRWVLIWSIFKVVVAIPFAIVGVIVHILPFEVIKQIAKRPVNEGMKATAKLLGCFASFVIVYAGLGVLVGERYGAWRIGGLLEGYRIVKSRRVALRAICDHRSMVVDAAFVLLSQS
jgi:glycerol-3-phosphate O-acyltransferase/dihydroxyacetone phosphate acyltransferase